MADRPGERRHGSMDRAAVQGRFHAARGRRDHDRFLVDHAISDMQTSMHFMNASAAAAADEPLAEPLIVEDRAAYLDEHLPADGAGEPGCVALGLQRLHVARRTWRRMRGSSELESLLRRRRIARMRSACGSRMRLVCDDVV